MDRDLQDRVLLFLNVRNLAQGCEIRASATSGVVVLKGAVPSFYRRQQLVACTRRVAGVVRVEDELDVFPTQSPVHHGRNSR